MQQEEIITIKCFSVCSFVLGFDSRTAAIDKLSLFIFGRFLNGKNTERTL